MIAYFKLHVQVPQFFRRKKTVDVMSNRLDSNVVLKLAPYVGLSDFTRFLPRLSEDAAERENVKEIDKVLDERNAPNRLFSYSDPVTLEYGSRSGENVRSLICPCFCQQWYSLTFRRTGAHDKGGDAYKLREDGDDPESGYDPCELDRATPADERELHLFGWKDYNEVLLSVVFPESRGKTTGLVVVAGSTSAGKSNIVRGLIHSVLFRLIRSCKSISRRPHLVTFEDPIETMYYADPLVAQRHGLDFTPRQKGKDVASLSDALRDALRQTPAVVYVGETRDFEEWQELLKFAATGHLIFTTCHAGSLTEVVSSIRDSIEADTTSKRGALASRLLGVVHVRAEKVNSSCGRSADSPKESKNVLLPAVWSRTPGGINALTSDGLAAILPHSVESQEHGSQYCYGRYYFAKQLLQPNDNSEKESYRDDLYAKAVGFDLDGL